MILITFYLVFLILLSFVTFWLAVQYVINDYANEGDDDDKFSHHTAPIWEIKKAPGSGGLYKCSLRKFKDNNLKVNADSISDASLFPLPICYPSNTLPLQMYKKECIDGDGRCLTQDGDILSKGETVKEVDMCALLDPCEGSSSTIYINYGTNEEKVLTVLDDGKPYFVSSYLTEITKGYYSFTLIRYSFTEDRQFKQDDRGRYCKLTYRPEKKSVGEGKVLVYENKDPIEGASISLLSELAHSDQSMYWFMLAPISLDDHGVYKKTGFIPQSLVATTSKFLVKDLKAEIFVTNKVYILSSRSYNDEDILDLSDSQRVIVRSGGIEVPIISNMTNTTNHTQIKEYNIKSIYRKKTLNEGEIDIPFYLW